MDYLNIDELLNMTKRIRAARREVSVKKKAEDFADLQDDILKMTTGKSGAERMAEKRRHKYELPSGVSGPTGGPMVGGWQDAYKPGGTFTVDGKTQQVPSSTYTPSAQAHVDQLMAAISAGKPEDISAKMLQTDNPELKGMLGTMLKAQIDKEAKKAEAAAAMKTVLISTHPELLGIEAPVSSKDQAAYEEWVLKRAGNWFGIVKPSREKALEEVSTGSNRKAYLKNPAFFDKYFPLVVPKTLDPAASSTSWKVVMERQK